jgi:hypothetical protein
VKTTQLRAHLEASLRSLSAAIVELRALGDDDRATSLTSLHDATARAGRSALEAHDDRRVVGGASVGAAWSGLRVLEGGKRGRR